MAGHKDMMVYKKAFHMASLVFRLSRRFPHEERYSLTDQILRSARAVSAIYAEGYRKRRYPAHFVLKMTEADGENTETQVWLAHALACEYVRENEVSEIRDLSMEVGRMLGDMIAHPEKYCATRQGGTT